MTHLDETEAFIAARVRGTTDLPLFAEAGATDGRVTPRVTMPGAGQSARADARARSHAKLDATYAKLTGALAAYPTGLTRKELAEMCALNVNTVNARIAELRKLPTTDHRRCITEGRRNGESVVRLAQFADYTLMRLTVTTTTPEK